MNCLTEALGLALPGNGSTLATHSDREQLFLTAGRTIVELCKRYYGENDESVLPRSIANFKAFENAMMLDIAMGGSTNTILHLLAAAQEGEVVRPARHRPPVAQSAAAVQSGAQHPEVPHGRRAPRWRHLQHPRLAGAWRPAAHRPADRAQPQHGRSHRQMGHHPDDDEAVHTFFKAGPAGIPTQTAFSQSTRWETLDDDRENGCIRSFEHAYSQEGGLAVLYGNIALDGCVVKTAGVDESIHVFEGTAKIFESQDSAVRGILDEVKAGDIVIIRYEGPKGGPACRKCSTRPRT